MTRWANSEELPALQALWKTCFGDGEDVTGAFFGAYPPERHTRVIAGEGEIAAMASWIPVTLCGQPGAYVYAVATAPDHRGRGLCRALMAELEGELAAQGLAFAVLCPAEASLYDFYAAMGYETAFSRRAWTALPGEEKIPLTQINANEYRALRETILDVPHCVWDERALAYLQATGTRFYRLPEGCAAASILPDGRLKIAELLGPDVSAALCRTLNAPRAEVSAPGMDRPHGMRKALRIGQKIPPAYLGFAFD